MNDKPQKCPRCTAEVFMELFDAGGLHRGWECYWGHQIVVAKNIPASETTKYEERKRRCPVQWVYFPDLW